MGARGGLGTVCSGVSGCMLRSFERVSADEGEDESRIEGVYDY